MYIQVKKTLFGKVRKVAVRYMDKLVTPEASSLRKSIRLRKAELARRRKELEEAK